MKTDAMKTAQKVLPANGTGNREARPKSWYVAQVRNCCEKKVAQRICSIGMDAFVPTQKEIHQWSDRKKVINRIVIPMVVFVKMAKDDIDIIRNLSFVYSLLKAPGEKEYAIIPDKQIEDFLKMLGQHDEQVVFEANRCFEKGMKVKVTRGAFIGLEGIVTDVSSNKTRIYVGLSILGSASMLIDVANIEQIS